jgi:hypothetical protein
VATKAVEEAATVEEGIEMVSLIPLMVPLPAKLTEKPLAEPVRGDAGARLISLLQVVASCAESIVSATGGRG